MIISVDCEAFPAMCFHIVFLEGRVAMQGLVAERVGGHVCHDGDGGGCCQVNHPVLRIQICWK